MMGQGRSIVETVREKKEGKVEGGGMSSTRKGKENRVGATCVQGMGGGDHTNHEKSAIRSIGIYGILGERNKVPRVCCRHQGTPLSF